MYSITPFIVSGAALAATLPDTLTNIQAPLPGSNLTDWVLRTSILILVTVILDEYRYRKDKRRNQQPQYGILLAYARAFSLSLLRLTFLKKLLDGLTSVAYYNGVRNHPDIHPDSTMSDSTLHMPDLSWSFNDGKESPVCNSRAEAIGIAMEWFEYMYGERTANIPLYFVESVEARYITHERDTKEIMTWYQVNIKFTANQFGAEDIGDSEATSTSIMRTVLTDSQESTMRHIVIYATCALDIHRRN